MPTVFVIGAGRSSAFLISYLLTHAQTENWEIVVGDVAPDLAAQKIAGHKNGRAIYFDVNDALMRESVIKSATVVVSMLPAALHLLVARDCLSFGKHLVTASYVSREIAALDAEASLKDLVFLNEMGLDPGIDHMSAMQLIDRIKASGGEITSFKSYCGGLISPESDTNPWSYKFTWNPRNVVVAGQGTAQYIENGQLRYIPYNRIFSETESLEVDRVGRFDAYANRDSLSYRHPYGLALIPSLLRGTLRSPGFCAAWNVFVKLGLTDDTYTITDCNQLTYAELLGSYLPLQLKGNLRSRLAAFLGEQEDSPVLEKINWLGILGDEKIKRSSGTPARILQDLLEEKWKLREGDKDRIVMIHKFVCRTEGTEKKITSVLDVKGEDQLNTAMAKTVGLPMAIAVKLILKGQIKKRGVCIPTDKEWYVPVLNELQTLGIVFREIVS